MTFRNKLFIYLRVVRPASVHITRMHTPSEFTDSIQSMTLAPDLNYFN